MAEAGIGQILAHHMRAAALETALQREADGVLAALGQHDILGRDRAEIAFGEPVHQRGAQPAIPAQPRIAEDVEIVPLRHLAKDRGDGGGLADFGQLRAAQVDEPRLVAFRAGEDADGIGQQRLRGAEARTRRGDEGAASDGGVEKPFLRHHLVGARDGSGRHAQPPGKIADRRQAGSLGQVARPDRLAQGMRQRQVFRAVEAGQVGLPFCIHDNSSLAKVSSLL